MSTRSKRRASLGQLVLSLVLVGLVLSPSSALATEDSITSPDEDGSVGSHSSLALDAADRPVISYYDATNGNLKVVHCGNPNCTAGNVIAKPDTGANTAGPEEDVGAYTSLALDGDGNPVVSYLDVTNRDLKILRCGNENCTSGNVITSPDTEGDVGFWTSLALDASGNPVVSYTGSTNRLLKVLHCGDPTCSAGNTIEFPDLEGPNGEYTSLERDASGNPVVSYHANRALNVLHCGDPACSSGNTITSPDTEGWVGKYTSLVLDADGNPVISHCDFANGDLKVLHCGDPECASGNIDSSPDTASLVGAFTSITLDAFGNPVVSYTYAGGVALKVLHCGNATCTGGNVLTTPDPGGAVYTSIALDAQGRPVVSYNGADADLNVLRCSGPDCTGTKPVGGIVEELPEVARAPLEAGRTPLEASASSGPSAAMLAGVAVAVLVGVAWMGVAAWYVRRRLHS